MGQALYAETNDLNYKNLICKRQKSVERKLVDLDEIDDKTKKKKGLAQSPSVSKLIISGSLANKFVEVLTKSNSQVSDIFRQPS